MGFRSRLCGILMVRAGRTLPETRMTNMAQEQVIKGAAEEVADVQEPVHPKICLVRLPLGHRLTGHPPPTSMASCS